jgi:hypothetical protein
MFEHLSHDHAVKHVMSVECCDSFSVSSSLSPSFAFVPDVSLHEQLLQQATT